MRDPLVEEASWRHIGVRVVEPLADQAGAMRCVSRYGEKVGRRCYLGMRSRRLAMLGFVLLPWGVVFYLPLTILVFYRE